MIVGLPRENYEGERRVALTPGSLGALTKAGLQVVVESDAGREAGYLDQAYRDQGATIVEDRQTVFDKADIIVTVRCAGANPTGVEGEASMLGEGKTLIGLCEPLAEAESSKRIAETGATLFSMELIPRITRAQSMDVLSSQASLAGYKAVIMAADALAKIFPMMMTAAGTITPAKVFVLGAGVAGLQAIATAKRLGAVVSATDVRPAVKDQVESLGGKFVFLEEIMAEGEGGYAKELTDEQKAKQQELIADAVAESDIVITTAAIPGRKAPVLVTRAMVERMAAGSVIVDMAAERGGNCELTEAGQTIVHNDVSIIGPANIPSTIAYHASQTYARNATTFLLHLLDDGQLKFDMEDEITAETLVTRGGEVMQPRVRERLGLEPLAPPAPAEPEAEETAAEGSGEASEPTESESNDESSNEGSDKQ